MDGGSLDKLVPTGVGIRDETILAWVTSCTTRGLKYLKDNLNIIHRGPPSLPFHLLTCFRRQTNKHPRQHIRRRQTLRLWRLR
jgi:hypothetical protein